MTKNNHKATNQRLAFATTSPISQEAIHFFKPNRHIRNLIKSFDLAYHARSLCVGQWIARQALKFGKTLCSHFRFVGSTVAIMGQKHDCLTTAQFDGQSRRLA
jgi:hypothetical protein